MKRRHPEEKGIYIYTNYEGGEKCDAVFMFKVTVGIIDGEMTVDPVSEIKMEPIQMFYDQRDLPEISNVAACVLDSKLYTIPHDEDTPDPHDPFTHIVHHMIQREDLLTLYYATRDSLPMYCFDLLGEEKVKEAIPECPLARKIMPFLTAIGHRVYAISSLMPMHKVPDPCFESFDPVTSTWTTLECPPFHMNTKYGIYSRSLCILGVVVLDDSFLLVSVKQAEILSYFSYKVCSKIWFPVQLRDSTPATSRFGSLNHCIYESAVAVVNNVYTYCPVDKVLLAFSYKVVTNDPTDPDCDTISLGPLRIVDGLQFDESLDLFKNYDSFGFSRTGTVAKVDDDILCVLHTFLPHAYETQHFCVSFVRLLPDSGSCTTLKSFSCTFLDQSATDIIRIVSCFVMNDPEEMSDNDRAKGGVRCKGRSPVKCFP